MFAVIVFSAHGAAGREGVYLLEVKLFESVSAAC